MVTSDNEMSVIGLRVADRASGDWILARAGAGTCVARAPAKDARVRLAVLLACWVPQLKTSSSHRLTRPSFQLARSASALGLTDSRGKDIALVALNSPDTRGFDNIRRRQSKRAVIID